MRALRNEQSGLPVKALSGLCEPATYRSRKSVQALLSEFCHSSPSFKVSIASTSTLRLPSTRSRAVRPQRDWIRAKSAADNPPNQAFRQSRTTSRPRRRCATRQRLIVMNMWRRASSGSASSSASARHWKERQSRGVEPPAIHARTLSGAPHAGGPRPITPETGAGMRLVGWQRKMRRAPGSRGRNSTGGSVPAQEHGLGSLRRHHW